jgi:hypothetical protein
MGEGDSQMMGRMLYVRQPGRRWVLVLRRLDMAPDPAFEALHGRLVSPAWVRELLPGWASLDWRHSNLGVDLPFSTATDAGYEVRLLTSGAVPHGEAGPAGPEMVREFLAALGGDAEPGAAPDPART